MVAGGIRCAAGVEVRKSRAVSCLASLPGIHAFHGKTQSKTWMAGNESGHVRLRGGVHEKTESAQGREAPDRGRRCRGGGRASPRGLDCIRDLLVARL